MVAAVFADAVSAVRLRGLVASRFATTGMGSDRHLRGDNPQDRMSALGQKRTYRAAANLTRLLRRFGQ